MSRCFFSSRAPLGRQLWKPFFPGFSEVSVFVRHSVVRFPGSILDSARFSMFYRMHREQSPARDGKFLMKTENSWLCAIGFQSSRLPLLPLRYLLSLFLLPRPLPVSRLSLSSSVAPLHSFSAYLFSFHLSHLRKPSNGESTFGTPKSWTRNSQPFWLLNRIIGARYSRWNLLSPTIRSLAPVENSTFLHITFVDL